MAEARAAEISATVTARGGRSEGILLSDGGRNGGEGSALPEGTSYIRIHEAQARVRQFAERVKPDLVKFLSLPAGREIAIHVPALIKTDAVVEATLGQLGSTYPILKPALKILTSSISDAISKGLGKQIDKVTSSIAASPDSTETILSQESKKIADSAPITVSPESRTDVINAVAELKSEEFRTDDLRDTLNLIANAIETVKIEELFTNLQSENADTREAAAEALSQKGRSLDREQINRLMEMVRSEGDYVETRSWRGEHCTHYERKALRYYAGLVVEKMDSPDVTNAMRQEAELAQTEEGGGIEYERGDDPGWI